MATQTTHLKRCDLISLEGRYDSGTAPELEAAIKSSMDQDVYLIVLDMSKVEYFGSAAIRVFVVAYKTCRRWNRGDVRLAAVPERIQHVFQLAGLWDIVGTFDDPTLAVGSF